MIVLCELYCCISPIACILLSSYSAHFIASWVQTSKPLQWKVYTIISVFYNPFAMHHELFTSQRSFCTYENHKKKILKRHLPPPLAHPLTKRNWWPECPLLMTIFFSFFHLFINFPLKRRRQRAKSDCLCTLFWCGNVRSNNFCFNVLMC